ncbi:nitroreductase family protein [Actinoplanes sp. CA-252034]|uniref:nitroreductase family protein n=1 Tax=Actinoplanes sp. CA-252034 TaxID=3239906 RepID=UPI003D98A725
METIATDVLATMRRRASCRRFTDQDVPPGLLDEIINAGLRAPTSFSLQPYALIVVREQRRRAALARVANGQAHVESAPVFVVVCVDLPRVERLTGLHGQLGRGRHDDALLNSVIDASLVGMCLSLAADSLGLGSVMVGAIRNDARRVSQILRLPDGVYPLFGVCLGWPARPVAAQPRQGGPALVHHERYHPPDVGVEAGLSLPDGTPAGSADVDHWRRQVRSGGQKLRSSRPVPWHPDNLAPLPSDDGDHDVPHHRSTGHHAVH